MVEPSQARKRRQSLTGIPDRFRPPVRCILTHSQMRRNGEREGLELTKISVLRCEQIVRTLESGTPLQLIDVRSRAEWLKGHLPGAISLPLQDLNPNTNPLDLSKPSLIYCHEGFRATTAASILLPGGGAV